MTGLLNKAGLLALAMLASACWQQQDVIRVTADGLVRVESEATVTDASMKKADIDKITDKVLADFIAAGWQMEKRWLSGQPPYRLQFVGQAPVAAIQDVDNFYRIERVDRRRYRVQFLLAGEGEQQVKRTIRLLTADGVQWIDDHNNVVREIEPVTGDDSYTLQFN
ncbi:MAG TPA: hypothetical protein VIN71_11465 [Pseudomonadales bacterium]